MPRRGSARSPSLRAALLADEGGFEAVHVPFPGSAPASTSVIAGDCHLIIDPIAAPHVEAGRLRALAVVGATRWDAFPDVPTLGELGLARTGRAAAGSPCSPRPAPPPRWWRG